MKAASIPFSPSPPKSTQRSLYGKSRVLRVSSDQSCFEVRRVSYRPPGTQHNLLNEVSFSLPEKSFGLIFGRSGSGKTTLLQLLAGFSKPTSGSIYVQRYGNDGNPNRSPEILSPERVGIVFQFPERFFLADTVIEEVTFGWPRQKADLALREQLALKLQYAINSVGLHTIPLDEVPHSLSGGFKRHLALAIQLVQKPDLLLLDEPLAGLDWKARADVVKLLKHLKKELTLLVVSHDLKELSALVDVSWRMEMGGILKEESLPGMKLTPVFPACRRYAKMFCNVQQPREWRKAGIPSSDCNRRNRGNSPIKAGLSSNNIMDCLFCSLGNWRIGSINGSLLRGSRGHLYGSIYMRVLKDEFCALFSSTECLQ